MSLDEDLGGLARAGYLPIDVDTDDGVVLLARLADNSFEEPWYDKTVANANIGHRKVVPIRSLVEQFADRQDEHLRLIAHTSRCGSTLLANLLSLRPTTLVLKEPDFVIVPAQKLTLAANIKESQQLDSLLHALINFSCHAAAAAHRELVIKLSSWTTPTVLASLGRRENTTWLLMWREPAKMVASYMATPPSFGRNTDTEDGRAARRLTGMTDMATGTAELYANIWSRVVDSFTALECDARWRALEYQDLTNNKAATFMAVESWFDLAATAGLPDKFEQESKRYSKGSPSETFEPTEVHRRAPLQSDDETAVNGIAQAAIKALREDAYHRL